MGRVLSAWVLAWIALLTWTATPLRAQAGVPNGRQLNVTVTNAAVVQLTVPTGTSTCVISISTNAVNYDIGSPSSVTPNIPLPTATTGIPITPGGIVQLASFLSCKNFGVIAQAGNAAMNVIFFR